MDTFKNFNITSYNKDDVIINKFTYSITDLDLHYLQLLYHYFIRDIFPPPFKNVYITNCKSCDHCAVYLKNSSKQINNYISITDDIYLKTNMSSSYEITTYKGISECSVFINMICFMLNEIDKYNLIYFNLSAQSQSSDNQCLDIAKFKFKIENEEIIFSCVNPKLTVYTEYKFNLIYKKDNNIIINTQVQIPISSYQDNFNKTTTSTLYIRTIGTSLIQIISKLLANDQISNTISYKQYIALKLKYKSKLKQKDDEIDRLKQISISPSIDFDQINEYICNINEEQINNQQLTENVQDNNEEQINNQQSIYNIDTIIKNKTLIEIIEHQHEIIANKDTEINRLKLKNSFLEQNINNYYDLNKKLNICLKLYKKTKNELKYNRNDIYKMFITWLQTYNEIITLSNIHNYQNNKDIKKYMAYMIDLLKCINIYDNEYNILVSDIPMTEKINQVLRNYNINDLCNFIIITMIYIPDRFKNLLNMIKTNSEYAIDIIKN